MLKDKFRKIFGSRSFYIVFSVLASVTIWLYVAYIENPDVSINIRGIRVEYLNKDYLSDRKLVISSPKADTVALKIMGKRNTVSKLTNSNISVSVDLSEIKNAGSYQLAYTVNYPIDVNPADLSVTSRSVDMISMTVDTLIKKDIPVRGTYDGGVAEGYQAEPIEISPDIITISGPKAEVSKVSYAWVSVLRQNITKNVEDDFPFVLMDDNGREVSFDMLTFSQNTIRVKIPVVMVKTIPLMVNLTPGAGADETNSVSTVTPSSITVSGDAETVKNLNQIVLGTIDLSSFLTGTTQTFSIALPNNTNNLTGAEEATVTVNITGLDSKHASVTNIQASNVTDGYSAFVVTKSLDILLRGKTESLGKVSPSQIRVVADLSGLGATTGTFTVLAKVYVDGDASVGAVGEYKVTVKISKD